MVIYYNHLRRILKILKDRCLGYSIRDFASVDKGMALALISKENINVQFDKEQLNLNVECVVKICVTHHHSYY